MTSDSTDNSSRFRSPQSRARVPGPLGLLATLGFVTLAACCAEEETEPLVPSAERHFTLRGRLEQPRLVVGVEAPEVVGAASNFTDVPPASVVELERFREAANLACERWNATGIVELSMGAREDAELVISFQRDVHGPCTPFGRDATIAHTGLCSLDNFTHLDADRDWNSDPALLERTLTHELGHALGLGHSLDPAAIMYVDDDERRTEPAASDIAGLHSLYGGGLDTDRDLALYSRTCGELSAPITVLREVAPSGRSAFRAFQTRAGRGPDLLVWRTDREGHGALTIYEFDDRGQVERTLGPLMGICPPGLQIRFGITEEGERLIVRVDPAGHAQALRFDEQGFPVARPNIAFQLEDLADADGDGMLDAPLAAEAVDPCGPEWCSTHDFNGDGEADGWRRLESPRSP